jgi:hypothetical protein
MPNHYTTIAICSPGSEFNCKEFNEKHAETCLCSVVKPMPEAVEQVPSVLYPDGTSEKQRRGVKRDWYDWAKENWGTKWGTYDLQAFELGGDSSPIAIKFQSAWSPPNILPEIAEWLKRVGKFDRVEFIGFDPYDDSTKLLSVTRPD